MPTPSQCISLAHNSNHASILTFSAPQPSRWSPSRKFLQIPPRSNTQHKPPPLIRNNSKLLLPILSILTTIKEHLELLQRRIHRYDLVHPAFPLEPNHSFADIIAFLDFACFEEYL